MVRALASHARGQWFKSTTAHHPKVQFSFRKFTKFTRDLLDNFLRSRASGTNQKTIELYHCALDRFLGYPLTPEGIKNYLDSLTCGNGKHNYYRCIKTLCNWLYRNDQLPSNPIDWVLPPRRQKKLLPAISKEQLDILLEHAPTDRDRIVLSLLWYFIRYEAIRSG